MFSKNKSNQYNSIVLLFENIFMHYFYFSPPRIFDVPVCEVSFITIPTEHHDTNYDWQ